MERGQNEVTCLSGFECDLDGAGFVSCSSPLTADHLAYGAHSIRVRAIDVAGNVDPTPATQSFSIARATSVRVLDA